MAVVTMGAHAASGSSTLERHGGRSPRKRFARSRGTRATRMPAAATLQPATVLRRASPELSMRRAPETRKSSSHRWNAAWSMCCARALPAPRPASPPVTRARYMGQHCGRRSWWKPSRMPWRTIMVTLVVLARQRHTPRSACTKSRRTITGGPAMPREPRRKPEEAIAATTARLTVKPPSSSFKLGDWPRLRRDQTCTPAITRKTTPSTRFAHTELPRFTRIKVPSGSITSTGALKRVKSCGLKCLRSKISCRKPHGASSMMMFQTAVSKAPLEIPSTAQSCQEIS
mmetsp:Transcript_17744/g.40129  ORF Transcript_17744/g.40129 Transcript_17744/m.40129 type:complete len:286 (+) Transcript_17744:151-1008(+)